MHPFRMEKRYSICPSSRLHSCGGTHDSISSSKSKILPRIVIVKCGAGLDHRERRNVRNVVAAAGEKLKKAIDEPLAKP